MAIAVVATGVAAWALLDRPRVVVPARAAPTGTAAAPDEGPMLAGPWGELELREVTISPRPGYLRPEMCDPSPPPWHMPGLTMAQAAKLAAQTSLAPSRVSTFVAFTSCTAAGCVAHPDLDFIAALLPAERASLYPALARFEGNGALRAPMRRRPGAIEPWFREAGVSEPTLALLRQVTWRSGAFDAFTDMSLLCARAPEADRERLIAAIARTPATLARLRVRPDSDVDALVRYWSAGSRVKDLRELLSSVARSPGGRGGSVDVAHLLPPFVRARLYNFPEPTDPPYDCIYSALNFFNHEGDARLLDLEEVKRTLARDYRDLGDEPLRAGDVILFAQADGVLLHAVAEVAGDLVFTKAGGAFHWPWVLAHRREIEEQFGNPVTYKLRRKDLDAPR